MADPRPLPQYGEYATPEEVAALRGTPDAVHAQRADPPNRSDRPARPADPETRGSRWRRLDRPITIALIAFGVLNLLQYSAAFLDFEGFLEAATEGTVAEEIDFTDAARFGGVVLFLLCLVLLVTSSAAAVLRLRRGRVAFWVPLVGGALTVIAWVVVLVVIVLQTPGALPLTGP
jgi:hypothetical protein